MTPKQLADALQDYEPMLDGRDPGWVLLDSRSRSSPARETPKPKELVVYNRVTHVGLAIDDEEVHEALVRALLSRGVAVLAIRDLTTS